MPVDTESIATQEVEVEDDGDIAGLIDSLMADEPESEEEPEAEEAVEESEQEEPEASDDTPAENEEPSSTGAAPEPDPRDAELERLRAQDQEIKAALSQSLRERQQKEAQKNLEDRFAALDEIDDPKLLAKERGSILEDVRNQERSIFLPRINQLEEASEASAQGIVALHYATQGFLQELLDGDITLDGMTQQTLMERIQKQAEDYLAFESPADMQREIQKREALKQEATARNRKLAAENDKLRKQLEALKLAGNPVNRGGGASRGNTVTVLDSARRKDRGTIADLIDIDEEDDLLELDGTGAY